MACEKADSGNRTSEDVVSTIFPHCSAEGQPSLRTQNERSNKFKSSPHPQPEGNEHASDLSVDEEETEIEENESDNSVYKVNKVTNDKVPSTEKAAVKNKKQNVALTKLKPKVKIKTLTIDGQLVYFCKICDKIFTRRKDKLNHELAHSGESVLTCTECGKEYLLESSLASHMRTHSGDQLYMCDLCPKMFAQSHHLKTHILTHSEPTDFSCKTCYKDFATSSDLSIHNRSEIKKEITELWCRMCKVFFCRNHDLANSNNKTRRLHAFRCNACNELFYTQKKLKIHMKKFAHKSVVKAPEVEPLDYFEIFPSEKDSGKNVDALSGVNSRTLADSKLVSSENNVEGRIGSKRLKLPSRKFCRESKLSSTSNQDSPSEMCDGLKAHELRSPVKTRKGKPYCKKCNKSFKDSLELDCHKLSVHQDSVKKPLECAVCKQAFSSKTELEQHEAKHDGLRNHTCPVCAKEFMHSLHLTIHLRTHTGDFPYKCSHCGKAFRLKLQLIQHVRLHGLPSWHSCDKCSLKFPSKQALQEHTSSIHGASDSFKCHLCSKSFCFRYKLLNHLRLHTNVKCFQCYICHKTFATKHNLQRHLQTHVKQGMDVDIKNIIVNEKAKLNMKAESENMLLSANVARADVCIEDGIERNVSENYPEKYDYNDNNAELFYNENCPSYMQRSSAAESHCEEMNSNTVFAKGIKVEFQNVEYGDKTGSDGSAYSSLTRDSEKSDPFKFSSDGSDSFKTVMAKERKRLRRKRRLSRAEMHNGLKKCKVDAQHSTVPAGTSEKMNTDAVSHTSGSEGEISHMAVELNGVRAESDNTMTVYVDLKQLKSSPSDVPSCSSLLNVSVKEEVKEETKHISIEEVKEEVNQNSAESNQAAQTLNNNVSDVKAPLASSQSRDGSLESGLSQSCRAGRTFVFDVTLDEGQVKENFSDPATKISGPHEKRGESTSNLVEVKDRNRSSAIQLVEETRLPGTTCGASNQESPLAQSQQLKPASKDTPSEFKYESMAGVSTQMSLSTSYTGSLPSHNHSIENTRRIEPRPLRTEGRMPITSVERPPGQPVLNVTGDKQSAPAPASSNTAFSLSSSASSNTPFSLSSSASSNTAFSLSSSASSNTAFSLSSSASSNTPFSLSSSASSNTPFSLSSSASSNTAFSLSSSASSSLSQSQSRVASFSNNNSGNSALRTSSNFTGGASANLHPPSRTNLPHSSQLGRCPVSRSSSPKPLPCSTSTGSSDPPAHLNPAGSIDPNTNIQLVLPSHSSSMADKKSIPASFNLQGSNVYSSAFKLQPGVVHPVPVSVSMSVSLSVPGQGQGAFTAYTASSATAGLLSSGGSASLPAGRNSAGSSSGLALNSAAIFDTHNPMLRDMNMLDLVSTGGSAGASLVVNNALSHTPQAVFTSTSLYNPGPVSVVTSSVYPFSSVSHSVPAVPSGLAPASGLLPGHSDTAIGLAPAAGVPIMNSLASRNLCSFPEGLSLTPQGLLAPQGIVTPTIGLGIGPGPSAELRGLAGSMGGVGLWGVGSVGGVGSVVGMQPAAVMGLQPSVGATPVFNMQGLPPQSSLNLMPTLPHSAPAEMINPVPMPNDASTFLANALGIANPQGVMGNSMFAAPSMGPYFPGFY